MSFKVTRQQPFEGLIGAFANTTDPNRTKHRLNIEKSDFPMLDFQNAFSMPLRNSKNRNQEWAKTHLEFDGEQDFMRYCLFLFARQYSKVPNNSVNRIDI
jgi:endo-1,4-beta-D-glucanase Y